VSTPILAQFMTELLSGRVRLVDLTQTLTPEFPTIVLPPEFGQAWPFRVEEISRYDERGPAWYWNNFSCSEHTGTHFDAPCIGSPARTSRTTRSTRFPVENFIAAACVIDVSRGPRRTRLPADDRLRREVGGAARPHSRARGVLLRTDWSKRSGAKEYLNMAGDGAHSPGPTPRSCRG